MSKFDFESLTLEEVETIEQLTGSAIDLIMDAGKPKGKALKALIWVWNKRTDPNFTIEQAAKTPLKEAYKLFEVEDPKA